ncbi:MAG: DUF5908 family protein [Chitinophagales bacterium]
MPIQIKELHIKATISNEGRTKIGFDKNEMRREKEKLKKEIIHECIEEILEKLKEKNER